MRPASRRDEGQGAAAVAVPLNAASELAEPAGPAVGADAEPRVEAIAEALG